MAFASKEWVTSLLNKCFKKNEYFYTEYIGNIAKSGSITRTFTTLGMSANYNYLITINSSDQNFRYAGIFFYSSTAQRCYIDTLVSKIISVSISATGITIKNTDSSYALPLATLYITKI